MNILHIEDEVWDSGIAHYALTLAAGLKSRGHDVHFWGRKGGAPCSKARDLGLGVGELSRPWLRLPRLRSLIKGLGIEIINAHTGGAHSWAAAAAAGLGIPIVRTRGDIRPPSANPLARALARRTAAFVAANSVIKSQLERAFAGARVEVVYQGLPVPRPVALAKEPGVGIVGRLDPVKGHEDFIEAAALLAKERPAARFYAAGAGTAGRDAQLRAAAQGRGLGRSLTFLGFAPSLSEFMARCRVGVVASRGSEAVSRAALEWMAQGRPLVATRVGCLPDLVADGLTGILVSPGAPEELARALARLLDDPELAASMGQKARLRFEARFGLERFVTETERIYLDLLHHLPS
ncbi:MAG: glycosyltransferase family 4 protein [Elusimicrobia bacterium]|nr:glycosyltransferase family 4 protein [Elusimicrobiota bacterium]